MENINMHQGLHHLSVLAAENHKRLERMITHIIGPRPSNENKAAPQNPGLIGHLGSLADSQSGTAQALSQLEDLLGVSCEGSGQIGSANISSPLQPKGVTYPPGVR